MQEMVQDKNIITGDIVWFIDAEGCYVSAATVQGTQGHELACVWIEKFKHQLVVRQCDLLKLVPKCAESI